MVGGRVLIGIVLITCADVQGWQRQCLGNLGVVLVKGFVAYGQRRIRQMDQGYVWSVEVRLGGNGNALAACRCMQAHAADVRD